jgi:hypothetical protein
MMHTMLYVLKVFPIVRDASEAAQAGLYNCLAS